MITKASTPKGMRDFSPSVMFRRNYIFSVVKSAFEKYGFSPIQTPAMENSETLTGKSETVVYFGIFKTSDTRYIDAPMPGLKQNKIKSAAVYNALKGTGMDVIVNPKYVYTVSKNPFVKTTTCQVSGYGAKIEIQ